MNFCTGEVNRCFIVSICFWLNGQDLRQLQLIERKKRLHVLRFVEKYFFDGLGVRIHLLLIFALISFMFYTFIGKRGGE
jgi:hypothetical protein